MAQSKTSKRYSAFNELGFSATIESCKEEIRELYLADKIPWVIGYSGGKDSTAVLQLVWLAISELKPGQRKKEIHVISTDTLVENPVVVFWVNNSLEAMQKAAAEQLVPIVPHRLKAETENSFWSMLIGRGYPAPRPKFRWCTERLKIMPSNKFIRYMVQAHGETILVLGTRKAESSGRAHLMKKYAAQSLRDRLAPNSSLPNSLIYTPVEDWANDDVWTFLMQIPNCWGYNNKDLLSMYQGASEDGECPLVVDTNTPSCGDSRFGCWVCTLVDEDKSMSAMIQNDDEKEWMLPLLKFRKELDFRGEKARLRDRSRREYRRITGKLTLYTDATGDSKLVPGPYKQEVRADLLRKLLQAQVAIKKNGPKNVGDLRLICLPELEEIRRTWLVDKHEIEDLLPKIYEDVIGEPYPGAELDDNLMFDSEALEILKSCCEDNQLHYELARNLLDVERRYRTMASRRGLFDKIEETVERFFYADEADALGRAKQIQKIKDRRRNNKGGAVSQDDDNENNEDIVELSLFRTAS